MTITTISHSTMSTIGVYAATETAARALAADVQRLCPDIVLGPVVRRVTGEWGAVGQGMEDDVASAAFILG